MVPPENVPLTSREQPAESATVDDLQKLKEEVTEQNIRRAIESLIDVARKNAGKIPEQALDAFQKSLTEVEKRTIAAFLSGEDFRGKLGTLAKSLGPSPLSSATDLLADASPVSRIVGAISAAVDRMGIGNQLNAVAAKFGFKGKLGDQSNFVKNFLIGLSAKLVEKLAFAFKSIYPNTGGMLDTAIGLRMAQLGITKTDERKIYTDAYRKRQKEASTYALFVPPANLEDAQAILTPPKKTETQPAQTKPVEEKPASDSSKKPAEKTA